MMQSMKGATKIIGGMNRSMNLPALSKIAQDFERENDIMEQRQEMMEDAVDDALGDPAEEEESEDVVNQILDELGVDFNAKVSCDGFICFSYRGLLNFD
jgi:charged multivesicular body protein 2A